MCIFRRLVCPALALCVIHGAALAQAWKTGHGNGHAYAEIASQKSGAALRIECGDGKDLWLRYYPGRGWNGAAKVTVRAGSYTSPMEIDGGDGALLSNVANNGIGITRALTDAMKGAGRLIIEGPATARVPVEQRTFVLGNAAAVISALESKCR